MSNKEIETITIDPYVDMDDPEFKAPSNYYIINSLGERVFIITRSRAKAEQWIADTYGGGFFKLRTFKIEKTNKPLSVRGTATR